MTVKGGSKGNPSQPIEHNANASEMGFNGQHMLASHTYFPNPKRDNLLALDSSDNLNDLSGPGFAAMAGYL